MNKEKGRQRSARATLVRVAYEEAERADNIASILAEAEPDAVYEAQELADNLRAAADRVRRFS